MSIVADSLKRLNNRRSKPEYRIAASKGRRFFFDNVTLWYLLVVVMGLMLLAGEAVYVYRQIDSYVKNIRPLVPIAELRQKLVAQKDAIERVKAGQMGLEELLVLGKLERMFRLAVREKNLKYQGIYYFKKGELGKAFALLSTYLKKHPGDVQARVYLAYVLYKQKKFARAIGILGALKDKNCAIVTDKACVYEAMGSPQKALELYRSAIRLCTSPAVRAKITKKIVVLEYYLRSGIKR